MKISDITLATNESDLPIRIHHALLTPEDISPLGAYYILKDLFGTPNGEFDDLKSQWAYYLRVPGAFLDIYDWKLYSWSIAVYEDSNNEIAEELIRPLGNNLGGTEFGKVYSALLSRIDGPKAERIGIEFLNLIRKHMPKSVGRIKKAAAEANDFILQNPFMLYYESAVNLLDKVEDSSFDAADYYRSAFFLFIAAFEGLLNLVYELYARTDLRDDRVYERLSREQIDIKVRLAPLYCHCFSDKLIDHNSDTFRRFHSIVNLRNDFVHANFTQPMKRPIIIEDGYTFVLEQSSRDKNGLPKSIEALNQEDIIIIKNSIDQMRDLLIEGMRPRFRREFRGILEQEYVQVTIEDEEIIVIGL